MNHYPAIRPAAAAAPPGSDDIAQCARELWTQSPGVVGDPVRAEAHVAPELGAPRVAPAPHILIVDDQSHDGWGWAGALRRAGFRVGIAADTDAGWHALDGDSYTLLITSQDPTGRTGLDLIRKVRAVPERLPCILVWEKTAPDAADVARLLQPGTTLEKPVTIAKLLSAVRELLRTGEDSRAAAIMPTGITPVPADA